MHTHNFFSSPWSEVTGNERNEIVFERLNKTYGAYEIRTNYDNTLLKAFSATGLLIVLLSAVYFIARVIPESVVKVPDTGIVHITKPPIDNPVMPKQIEQPKINTSSAASNDYKPVVTDHVDDNINDPILPLNQNNTQGTGTPSDSMNITSNLIQS